MLPRRYGFLLRNRILFLVLLLCFAMGLMSMSERNAIRYIVDLWRVRLSSASDMRTLQTRKPPPTGVLVKELVDVAPLPEEKHAFDNPVRPESTQLDLDDVYKKRRDRVRNVCKQMDFQPQSVETWATQMRKLRPLNITICPLPQSSRTWRKVLEIWLRSQPTTRSSLVINQIRFEKSLYQYNVSTSQSIAAFKTDLNQTLKVLFTQDPYSQLFELYVDHIIMPRQESLGVRQNILQMANQNVNQTELECAHNITFHDFFLFFLNHKNQLPISVVGTRCDACGLDFDVIGKEGTLDQDIKYVYSKIKAKAATSSEIEDFRQEIAFDRIQTFITTAIASRYELTCMSPHMIYKRLWRQLQILGYISKDITYPFTKENSETLEESSLSNAVLKAYHSSTPGSAINREEAMSQAYMDISLRDLNIGRSWFERDFFMFGYPDRPALLFFKQGPLYDFNYYDIVPLKE